MGLRHTPLIDLHRETGAKLVSFAGYEMPVQFTPGVMKEHLHCRTAAALFDVSHMGQIVVTPRSGDVADALAALERLVPGDLLGLKPGRQRYGLLTNEAGGILDDLMIGHRGDALVLVVNAANKAADLDWLIAGLDGCDVAMIDRALIALQGPRAEDALGALVPEAAEMRFMDWRVLESDHGPLWISRSGYTGEDGFEISVAEEAAEAFARAFLEQPRVAPAGLGARDSLRLEAGLCLHGQDIDAATSPIEANLLFAVAKARRRGGAREGGFPGAARILHEIETAPVRLRVGLLPRGRAPMRGGVTLYAGEGDETPTGRITSGGFGPSVERPLAMGYVGLDHAAIGATIFGELRGKRLPLEVTELPFRHATYKR